MHSINRYKQWGALILIMALGWSCSASQPNIRARHTSPEKPDAISPLQSSPSLPENLPRKRSIIVQHALNSIGTPYKWGGESPETGFDCSGLVVFTHKKAGIILPRTAKDQFKSGKTVLRQDLQTADLVFFTPPDRSKSFHVGIYIGEGLFVHAPGRGRQVSVVDLNHPYFKKHYIGSRSQ